MRCLACLANEAFFFVVGVGEVVGELLELFPWMGRR